MLGLIVRKGTSALGSGEAGWFSTSTLPSSCFTAPLMKGVPITVVNGSSLLPGPLFLDGEGLGHSLPPCEEFQHESALLLWPWVSSPDFTQSSSMTFLLRGCGVGSVGKGTCCARQRPEFESPYLCKSWLCKMRFCNSVVPQEDGRWTEGPGSSGTS